MRNLLLLLTFCTISTAVFCQQNIKPGYIIDLKGDTVKGYINFRDWKVNPETIFFGSSPSTVNTAYRPDQIKAFGVAGSIYLSSIVQVNICPYNTKDLDFSSQPTLLIDTVFLEGLVLGNKCLYAYFSPLGRDNFYISENNSNNLLVFQQYKKETNDLQNPFIKMTNYKYIGQLLIYFNDCPSLKSLIEKSRYTREDLVKLFTEYYKCSNGSPKYLIPKEKNRDEAGVFLGFSSTAVKFKGDYDPYLTKAKFSGSTDFTAGLFYNVVFSKNLAKWSIFNELQYARYGVEAKYEESTGIYQKTTTYSELDLSYIKLNNLLRYTWPVKNIRVYTEIGMSNGFTLSIHNYKKEVYVFGPNTTITEGTAVKAYRSYEQSLLLGLGVKYHKNCIGYRFEAGNGMSDFKTMRSSVNVHYVFLSWYLK